MTTLIFLTIIASLFGGIIGVAIVLHSAWYQEKETKTLRDTFAAKAMNGICSHPDTWGLGYKGVAEVAFKIADEMLAERGKK